MIGQQLAQLQFGYWLFWAAVILTILIEVYQAQSQKKRGDKAVYYKGARYSGTRYDPVSNKKTALKETFGAAWWLLGALSLLNILIACSIWIDQIGMMPPATAYEQVEVMHLDAVLHGQPVYQTDGTLPAPTSNPFYYLLATPFALLFGVNVTTLRLVSLAGTLCSALVIMQILRYRTRTYWWGVIAVGLCATMIGTINAYAGLATPDSWLLCCTLLGTHLIDRNESVGRNLLGILLLVNAFWFRQIGILFLLPALIELTRRSEEKVAWLYWGVGLCLTVGIWLFVAPTLFGTQFHQATFVYQLREFSLNANTLLQYLNFISLIHPLAWMLSLLLLIYTGLLNRRAIGLWHLQFISAALVGLLGMASSIQTSGLLGLACVWSILISLFAIYQWSLQYRSIQHTKLHVAALFASFILAL